MSISRGAGALVLLAAVLGIGTGVGAAGAQTAGCPSGGGLSAAQITIEAPSPNQSVSGTVTVRGVARLTLVGSITRVEVSLGGVSAVQPFDATSEARFNLSLDASALPPGPTSLEVAACGPLAFGERSITVNVTAPATTSSTARVTTTTVAGPSTTSVGVTTTSVTTQAGGGPVAAGATTSTRVTTTSTSTPPTTEAPAPVAPTTTAGTTPRSGRDTPLVLTETPPRSSSGPPVWVGAVVGISGGLGLLFSARPWRRRSGVGGRGGGGPGDLPSVDEDLISTGER